MLKVALVPPEPGPEVVVVEGGLRPMDETVERARLPQVELLRELGGVEAQCPARPVHVSDVRLGHRLIVSAEPRRAHNGGTRSLYGCALVAVTGLAEKLNVALRVA